ncbi:MAG: aspartate carbamoyltransferase catalytic subunit [Phycisphaerae bacterium]|jgi:aspartate carbamoyltransferase catalytic subunit
MATLASPRHLLGLQNTPREQIVSMLRATRQMQRAMGASRGTIASAHATALMGKVVANLFFEDSTRTRLSFSVAAKRLGAEVIDLQGQTSSVSKGETLIDTATNIEAMGVSALVVRARQSGAAALIASRVRIPVLNAGDGRHEHPTQALLDAYTIAQSHGREEFDLSGLTVAIVGDVNASRVARSNIACLTTLGARVVCVGSPQLAPRGLESLGCSVTHDLDAVLPQLDAIMMLRIQFERYEAKEGAKEAAKPNVIASVREYRAQYALTAARAERLKHDAIVMHPGPINRGIELDAEVADGPQSVILKQVSNGVLVRMAALKSLIEV